MSTPDTASVTASRGRFDAACRLIAGAVVAVMLGSNACHHQRAVRAYAVAKAAEPTQATGKPARRTGNDRSGAWFAPDGSRSTDTQAVDGPASNSR
jgi:hypothetical protein